MFELALGRDGSQIAYSPYTRGLPAYSLKLRDLERLACELVANGQPQITTKLYGSVGAVNIPLRVYKIRTYIV